MRVELVREALVAAGHEIVPPDPLAPGDLESVHDRDFLEFLATAWERWQASGYPHDPGQDRVVPYAFPLPALTPGRPARIPVSVGALTGTYAMDTMTLIGPGTWKAVQGAAACALTAAHLVAGGQSSALALVRPPGHHAARRVYGGACYVNNAALAAHHLQQHYGRVSVVDLDAHHGNGTQEIFYRSAAVRYGSVHVDPGAGYFPHFLGFADERGAGDGDGANLNLPLAPGSGDGEWLEAVATLTEFARPAAALVVSLGVDAWRDDPESPLEVTIDGFRRAGSMLASLTVPTVIVFEGGYDLAMIGALVTAFVDGFGGRTV
jgi:acetoin utilization deacetylase AcuC-like enzyme